MMKRVLLLLVCLFATPVCAQQLNPGGSGGTGTGIGGNILVQSINNTYLWADQFPGTSIDAKLAAAEAQCPNSGCTIDASNITGPQTWAATVTLNKPTHLKLNGQISYTGPPLANGLIYLAQGYAPASGSDISCASGRAQSFVWPPSPNFPPSQGGPLTLNPSNLLQIWPCYILTHPNAPLGTVTLTNIVFGAQTSPTLDIATATGPVPFVAGQGVRISGATPSAFNRYVIVQNVSGDQFTYVTDAWEAPASGSGATGGTASSYMPVIRLANGTANVRIHDMNFVPNANTGSVIYEGGATAPDLAVVNNSYDHNQMINTDGVGGSGYAIELSSAGPHYSTFPYPTPPPTPGITAGPGLNFNQKEIKYNTIAGLAGCIYIGQSQLVGAEVIGNACSFGTGTQVQFDCYQCVQNQTIDYRLNVFWDNLTPADHAVLNLQSGYQYQIENNDFELPNPLQNANVDFIRVGQGQGTIKNNAFLSTSGTNAGRYSINVANTSAYGLLYVDGNHSSGGEQYFFHDPYNPVPPASGGFQGHLYYGHNEDKSTWPTDTHVYPWNYQYTGGGTGANYTTTSTTYVPIDSTRMSADFWFPSGYILLMTGSVDATNNTAGEQACIALVDTVTNTVLNQKVAANVTNSLSEVSVQYLMYPDNNHHTIALEMASCGGGGTTTVANQNTASRPVMTLSFIPSNGASN